MCLNQILKSEQITPMQHAVVAGSADASTPRRKLNMFQKLLKIQPSNHPPDRPLRDIEIEADFDTSAASGRIAALDDWENEWMHADLARLNAAESEAPNSSVVEGAGKTKGKL